MDDSFYNEQMIHRAHRSIIWDSEATWAKCYEACICQPAPEEANPKPALNGDGLCSTQNTRTPGSSPHDDTGNYGNRTTVYSAEVSKPSLV